jgi:hypothetical protein
VDVALSIDAGKITAGTAVVGTPGIGPCFFIFSRAVELWSTRPSVSIDCAFSRNRAATVVCFSSRAGRQRFHMDPALQRCTHLVIICAKSFTDPKHKNQNSKFKVR